MDKIKPCPFCGGNARFEEGSYRDDGYEFTVSLRCDSCFVEFAYRLNPKTCTEKEIDEAKQELAKKWNKRI